MTTSVCTGTESCSTTIDVAPQLFKSALHFLAATQCFIPDDSYEYTKDNEYYDFIIVGGGSAGSVVANRLSEINDWKILLLEAGSKPPIESDIPYLAFTQMHTKYDWEYYTQNDGVRHQVLNNDSVYWPRGKMLGGCSSINSMFYIKGRDHDFQAWENAGNPSWSPKNVEFYYRKAESYQNFELLRDPVIRRTYGLDGPQVINKFNSTSRKLDERILESWNFLGFKRVIDINAVNFQGLGLTGIFSATAANGRRYSTYKSYLEPIKERKNLKILTNAFVTKILIDDNKQAYGLEVDIFGEKKIFYANIEVIISAGSVNTPQLLMLSGIGPKEHLLSKNISCVVDLSGVGKNLHDHNSIPIVLYGDKPGEENEAEQLFEVAKYMYNRSGLLATNTFSHVAAFFSRNLNLQYPEFQSQIVIQPKNSKSTRDLFSIYRENITNSFIEFSQEKAMYVFYFYLLHPFSRGTIYLKTSNPYDHPIINANYFGNTTDLQAAVEGIKMLAKIVKSPYFRSINGFVHRVDIPECNQYEFESDRYWECYAVSTCATVYHPVGTAKMGPNPKDSVVNNFLKVHGVKGLRVIDASIMPSVTSGNTNAPSIMIGEMGSDMIKNEHNINQN